MATVLYPWQILVAAMAGWITRQQDAVIDYLREENRVLKEHLGRKRLRLTDAHADPGSTSKRRPSGRPDYDQ